MKIFIRILRSSKTSYSHIFIYVYILSVQIVSCSEDVVDGRRGQNEDLNYNVDWKICPTSVTSNPTSDYPLQLPQVNDIHNILPVDVGDIASFLRRGKHYNENYEKSQALSRDEVILDLLEPAEVHGRKVHVEDFLWTGSGNAH